MSLSTTLLAGIIFLVAIIFSMLGQGGGVLYTPVQVLFGIDFHVAASTSLFLIMLASLSSTLVFRKAKKVDWSLALVLESVTAVGGFIGGFTSGLVSGETLTGLFSGLVAFAAIFMIHEFKHASKPLTAKNSWFYWQRSFNDQHYAVNLLLALPVSFLAGTCSGLVGVGGGILKVPLMVLLLGIPMDIAVGSSALMVGLTAAGGFAGHLTAGHWDWQISLLLGVVVFAGGQIGARKSLALDSRKMKKMFGWFLLLIAIIMLVKNVTVRGIVWPFHPSGIFIDGLAAKPVIYLSTSLVLLGLALYYNYRLRQNILKNHISTAQLLGAAVALRDHGTAMHNFRVTYAASRLGEVMGLSKRSMQGLMKGAFLHDVGKIGIADNILKKPGKLEPAEFILMQRHVELGVELLTDGDWFHDALDIVRYHHEKYDGSGYLQQLRGKEIPLAARIFMVVDVFDALISKRPYKEALAFEQAIKMIKQQSAHHFDPEIVAAFCSIAKELSDEVHGNEEQLKQRLMEKRIRYFGI